MALPPLSPPKQEKNQRFKIPFDRGLQLAENLLGVRDLNNAESTLDAVFVSIDLEVSRQKKRKSSAPFVREFGVATLDTRQIQSKHVACISTRQFSTINASSDYSDCDVTDFKECVFAETFFVPWTQLADTITGCLQIRDENSSDPSTLRNIVIVGHSVKTDLSVIRRLGVDVHQIAPVIALCDTFGMAKSLLGPDSSTPATGFRLTDILTALNCPHNGFDLHNAGNDATYTLHAMLALVVRACESTILDIGQRENYNHLHALAQREMHDTPRWKPIRRSLAVEFSSSANILFEHEDEDEDDGGVVLTNLGP